ncbi:unnamed protein product, partial [Symbiodinium necroappetens]
HSADGTTMYRDRRLTLEQLGGTQESAVVTLPRPPQLPPSTSRRIRILSKNVGGLCTSTHDVFMNWLTSARNPYDVVFLQETHHGLGRAFTEYKVPGWTVISSPDPSHRWAGVALYISERLARDLNCTLSTDGQHVGPGTYRGAARAAYPNVNDAQQARRSQLLPNCDFRRGVKVTKTPPTGLCRSTLREATVSTAAELTRVVHDSCQKVNRDTGLIAYAFEAFRRHAAFQRCQKALRQRGRERRRALVQDILQEAEQAASTGDMHAFYRHVRRLAPKAPREHIQIRGPDNTILDPAQEFQQIYEYFTHLYQQGPDTCNTTYVLQHDYNITDTEILTSLKQQKAGKAVPQGKVPPDVWKRCAHLLLPHVSGLFQQHLSAGAIDLPTDWRDGWLHLLPKPHKPTKAPANLRPIALQCPLGKCLARIIKTRILKHILPRLDQVPQYAYLPGRSTTNAISRIAAAGSSTVSHSYLAAAMRHLEIDEDTIQLTLALHQASYHITHHQHEGSIALRNGIRQGCVLSPLLWVCVTTYMLHCLSQRTSPEWVRDEVTAFADDFICSFTLHKVEDAQLMSQRIQQLFLVLREAGMQANAEKSHFLVKAVGGPLHRWLAKRSFRQRDALFYDMGTPFEPLKLAYSSSIDYLGPLPSTGLPVGFQNHILRQCPAMTAEVSKTSNSQATPSASVPVPQCAAGEATAEAAPAPLPLFDQPDTRSADQLWTPIGSLLLKTMAKRLKNHIRRMHPSHWSHRDAVIRRLKAHYRLRYKGRGQPVLRTPLRAMATQEDAAATKRSPPREEGPERWQREWHGEEQTLSQKISGDELREAVGFLARLALKHEDTEAALRSDTSFMLYFNTRGMTITRALYNIAQEWRRLKDEGKINQSLRVTLIIGMLTAVKEKMQTALHEEANPPAWAYMTYNQEKEEQEVDAIKPPLPHAQAEATIQRIFELISMNGLLMKFHATRPMAPTYRSEVLPFVLMVSNRGALADELHGLFSTLCNNACLSLIGVRMRPDRMKRQPLAVKLGQCAESLMDATNPYRGQQQQEASQPSEPKPAEEKEKEPEL